jgi:transglutaminase-like putative cysteine protease
MDLSEQDRVRRDDPSLWLGNSPLLDLDDPRVRVRAHALTQSRASPQLRAVAIYSFVKRIPYSISFRMRLNTAREVLDRDRGDSADKATLLVAMLRIAGIPARMRWLTLHQDVMRGLCSGALQPTRAVAEIWLGGEWVATDSFTFDAEYAAAARERLKANGWTHGYGLHAEGKLLWDGRSSGYTFSRVTQGSAMVEADHGVFCDPLEFVSSESYRQFHGRFTRAVQLNMLSPVVERAIRDLRADFRFA